NSWDADKSNTALASAMESAGFPPRNTESLHAFAAAIGRSPRMVQSWLYENRVPRKTIHDQIAAILGKPIEALFPQLACDDGQPIPNAQPKLVWKLNDAGLCAVTIRKNRKLK